MNKIHDDARQWFKANNKKTGEHVGINGRGSRNGKWRAPSAGVFKCNVGTAWSKGKSMAGAEWIVRDSRDEFMLYSGRAFSGIGSLIEAKQVGLLWLLKVCARIGSRMCVWKLKLLSWWVLWIDQVLGLLSERKGVNLVVLCTN